MPYQPTLDCIKCGLDQASRLDAQWDVLYIGCNPAFTMTRRKVAKKAAQEACDTFISSTYPAAKLKIAITPIPLGTIEEYSDTVKFKAKEEESDPEKSQG
jgi:hypothetical protein